MHPIALAANQPANRFYRGGDRIAAFRRTDHAIPFTPEDWVGSTTSLFGHNELGVTRLPDGRSLRDAIHADPVSWLGAEHVAAYGDDAMLLVKLLDAGQRLPVHAHPNDGFARAKLGIAHGKAEAWYILEPGTVFLGLTRAISLEILRKIVDTQDVARLISLLNPVHVEPGDSVFIPAGTLHAIDEGVLLIEVQQPTDLSILLEWDGFDIDGRIHGHLGLGFDTALGAVDRDATEADSLSSLVGRRGTRGAPSVLPPVADRYFRLELLSGAADIEPGFAIVTVTEGEAILAGVHYAAGSTLLIPHAAGAVPVDGDGQLVVARPPRYDAR